MTDEHPYELAYEAALRSLAQQENTVDNLRTRAGTVLAAVTISTSFLGSVALADGDRSCWAYVGLAGFVLCLISCMWIVRPRKNAWVFRLEPDDLILRMEGAQAYSKEIWQRGLAIDAGRALKENDERINELYWTFQAALVFLMLEVVGFIAELLRG